MGAFAAFALGTAVLALGILMLGVLRVQAEVLRRLSIVDRLEGRQPAELPKRGTDSFEAHDIFGQTPTGAVTGIALASPSVGPHLVAFLSSGCTTCQQFWDGLRGSQGIPAGVDIVIVTKDRSEESPSRLMELAPPDLPLVMSSAAWSQYEVPSSPYFVYVGRGGQIEGEGTATEWTAVVSLFKDALLDEELTARYDFSRLAAPGPILRGRDDVMRDNRVLQASGVMPGDPTLYSPSHQGIQSEDEA